MQELNSEKINKALEILNDIIAKLTREFSIEKDIQEAKILQSKLELLEKYREQAIKGNMNAIEHIIEEYNKGAIKEEIMREIEIERKAPLKMIESLVEILEKKYGEEFKKSLPCPILEIAKFARRRINPIVNSSIPEEIRIKMINDKEHGGTKLTDLEYLDTFIQIVSAFTRGCNKKAIDEEKFAHIITAQTGAGKTMLRKLITKNVEKPVIIDPDRYKQYRPDIDEIDKDKFGMLTGIDSYDHRDNLASFAIENGYDLLYEVAPTKGGNLIGVNLQLLAEKGYILSLNIMAVGDIVSAVGVHTRYEKELEQSKNERDPKPSKLTDLNRHDESVEAIEEIVKEYNLNNNVSIYIRGNESNEFQPILIERDDIEYSRLNNFEIYKKLQELSNRIYIESRQFEYDIEFIKAQMENRNAPNSQKEQLAKIEERGQKIIDEKNRSDYGE